MEKEPAIELRGKKSREEGKEKDEELQEFFTYKDIGSEYFQVLVNKGRPSLCKIIWWLISAVLFVFCAYMVYKLLVDYFQYNSYDKVHVKWMNNVTLPAITICSPNVLNYTRIKETLNDTQLDALQTLIKEIEGLAADVTGRLTDDRIAQLQKEYSWLDKLDYGDDYEEGLNLFEFYKMDPYYFTPYPSYEYKFAGKEIFMSQNEYNAFEVPHELGTCLSLNDNQKMVQTLAGSKWGLTIDLNAKINDYLFSTESAGFKVFLRNVNETLLLQDSGYLVQPGMETFINLNKKKVTRLPKPYGNCVNTASTFEPSHMRTTRECNEDLKLKEMTHGCECVPWYLAKRIENVLQVYDIWSNETSWETAPVTAAMIATYARLKEYWISQSLDDGTEYNATEYEAEIATCSFLWQQICNVYVQQTLLDLNDKSKGYDQSLKCKESCKYNAFDVEITSSVFPPTEAYFDRMILPRCEKDDALTFEKARNNLVRLHVFYGDLTETTVEQEKAYELQNFIAEFGGTVDLLIGISFFTLFQVGEIMLAYFVLKCWRRGNAVGDNEPV